MATTNDAVFFVDGESVDPANAASEVWLEIRPDNHGARTFRELVAYDCAHHTSTTLLFATERAETAASAPREVPPEKRQARAVTVESADGKILSFVCAPEAERASHARKATGSNAAVAEQFFTLRRAGLSADSAQSMVAGPAAPTR